MKTCEEVAELAKEFSKVFKPAIEAGGNKMFVGYGGDLGEESPSVIFVYLENGKLRGILPETYDGVKVNVNCR